MLNVEIALDFIAKGFTSEEDSSDSGELCEPALEDSVDASLNSSCYGAFLTAYISPPLSSVGWSTSEYLPVERILQLHCSLCRQANS